MSSSHRTRRAVLAGLLLAGLGGCGEASGTVAGTVTLDGKPVTAGTLSVMVGGVAFSTGIGEDGRYGVGPVPLGDAVVLVIDPPDPAAEAANSAKPTEEDLRSGRWPPKVKVKPPVVPAKYGDATQSPLKLTVKSGDNPFDVKLTK